MDFITDLPPSKSNGVVYDSILIFVDRFTKMSHYVPTSATLSAEAFAEVYLHEIVCLHGVPDSIMSDCGPIMVSKYWNSFAHHLSTKISLSTAFHPQTNGQTERQNQTLEQYLRMYCCLEQDDWSSWLPTAEFAYNDSAHESTGITPFFAYTASHPRGGEWPKLAQTDGKAPLGKGLAAKVIALQEEMRRKLKVARCYQKKYADKKRMHHDFKVGDKVLVSSRNIRSQRPKKKLDYKYLGPGTILAQIGPSSFKVDLPGLQRVHPVFHASLLEAWKSNERFEHPDIPTIDTLRSLGDDVYEVETILARKRNEAGIWEYFIKWRGFPESENSWEPGPNITGAAIRKFWEKNNITRSKKPKGTKLAQIGQKNHVAEDVSKKRGHN